MRTETITYEDYNGESRTETFYFNLTKAELGRSCPPRIFLKLQNGLRESSKWRMARNLLMDAVSLSQRN